MKFFLSLLVFLLFSGLSLRASPQTGSNSPAIDVHSIATTSRTPKPQLNLSTATLLLGSNSLIAQIAADDASRELGLMSHTNLSDTEGMVFVFPRPQPVTFWMKDTPIPLSVAYIDHSGRILEIYDMKPFDETTIPSVSESIVYALEVSKGWFSRHGVLSGDTIIGLPSTSTAK